jgi:hypothetical protein
MYLVFETTWREEIQTDSNVWLYLCYDYCHKRSILWTTAVLCSPYREDADPGCLNPSLLLSVVGLAKRGDKLQPTPQGDLQAIDTNITISTVYT